jgi:hypothetical protein
MKSKSIILLLGVFLFNSCIVRSLNPFYTQDKISYDTRLEGEWNSKNAIWKFQSFAELWKKEWNKNKSTEESKKMYERYKSSYVVEYYKTSKFKKKEDLEMGYFVATPFKVNNDLMLNFYPLEYDTDSVNNLAVQHILNTNSVCLVEFLADDTFKLKWLDEGVVSGLIEGEKLKIKHEMIGIDEDDLILTASSKELYRFLEKFLNSDIEDKWDNDQIFTLSKVNATP